MSDNNFDISVRHIAHQSRWFLNASRYALQNNANNTEVFGTHRRAAVELIEDSLNQQLPTVRDPHPTEEDKQIVNLPETAAAREKQEAIQKAFAEWAWSDPKRSHMLAAIYNAKPWRRHAKKRGAGAKLEILWFDPFTELLRRAIIRNRKQSR